MPGLNWRVYARDVFHPTVLRGGELHTVACILTPFLAYEPPLTDVMRSCLGRYALSLRLPREVTHTLRSTTRQPARCRAGPGSPSLCTILIAVVH
ncbi:hypothetical protein LOAG_11794 [Loa loa]|uniref:DUF5753 domain-containing protein n=1 Tax=Loa loa TaxID=7209 RepID=A0A1I7VP08_LOALO|nr:hypothetical protein LOAG_11794 [Loa loa]EFO16710.2 hypothetical protein LOAG_11794 [Loa loa]